MSTLKHSPPPWRFDLTEDYDKDCNPHPREDGFILDANGMPVTEYKGCGSHECEIPNPADRALLIAAPDLLAAAEQVCAEMKHVIQWDEDDGFQALKTAVAKAMGSVVDIGHLVKTETVYECSKHGKVTLGRKDYTLYCLKCAREAAEGMEDAKEDEH